DPANPAAPCPRNAGPANAVTGRVTGRVSGGRSEAPCPPRIAEAVSDDVGLRLSDVRVRLVLALRVLLGGHRHLVARVPFVTRCGAARNGERRERYDQSKLSKLLNPHDSNAPSKCPRTARATRSLRRTARSGRRVQARGLARHVPIL